MKNSVPLMVIALACVSFFVIGGGKSAEPGPIRGTSFELVGADGKVCARLAANEQGTSLTFLDKTGKGRVSVGMDAAEGGDLRIRNSHDQELVVIREVKGSPELFLQGEGKGSGVWAKCGPQTAAILVTGSEKSVGGVSIAGTTQGGRVSLLSPGGGELAALAERDNSGTLVVGSRGTTRSIQLRGKENALMMYDGNHAARVGLTCDDEDGPAMAFYDRRQRLRALVGESESKGRIALYADKNSPVLEAMGGDKGAAMRFCAPGDRVVEHLLLTNIGGSGKIKIADLNGKVAELPASKEAPKHVAPPEVKGN